MTLDRAAGISAVHLRKVFTVQSRGTGLRRLIRSAVRADKREIVAVDDVSFTIEPGEVVGLLGPNGAGKTTVLKMLTGLLHPSSGELTVRGVRPAVRDNDFLRSITMVMGQRYQLVWDIPALDSFELNRAVYRVPDTVFRQTLDELVELLDLEPLLSRPVRTLSLGQRMRCEIAGALLHRPSVVFLDEPTIGLDIVMQRRIREFVRRYNATSGATVLLTSHYMTDVEELCRRVILLDKGTVLYDGALAEFVAKTLPVKRITVKDAGSVPLASYGSVVEQDGARTVLQVPTADAARVVTELLSVHGVADLEVTDPAVEDVIARVFAGGSGP